MPHSFNAALAVINFLDGRSLLSQKEAVEVAWAAINDDSSPDEFKSSLGPGLHADTEHALKAAFAAALESLTRDPGDKDQAEVKAEEAFDATGATALYDPDKPDKEDEDDGEG